MSNQRVLVLGASGFVGRRIVHALTQDPALKPVAGVHRRPLNLPEVTSVSVNATDPASLAQALDGVDMVVNAVLGGPATIVSGMRTLLQVAAIPLPRIIHLSTLAVYGSQEGTVNESAALRPDLGPYGQAKIDAERLLQAYPARVVLRPGIVYGPGGPQWSTRIATLLASRRLGDLGEAADGYANLVHVDDVAAAVVAACHSHAALGQTFNLGLPHPPTWNEYFVAFACALGATPVHTLPGWQIGIEKLLGVPLEVLRRVGERAGLDLPHGLTPSLFRLWKQRLRLDVHAASGTLGVHWTPLPEGLAQTVRALEGIG